MLEHNKMAFITGASGDGKSSMVYAGVVPYIRAGFSKAKFNSWVVCDFKPQRNPLESLAHSASEQLQVPYQDTLIKLRRGFSALVNVYKQSGFYVQDGDDAANRGKNLLIIADQFEEVFTMKENFHNGTPSNDTYTAVNLLLETIRISVTEQLPVYVIFTMRSDYISQCTVFKDLPEFIAYSQFFVPQLKRTEILQVIEQPAVLAGGSVSTRLTEVLFNNLNSGFDQLPVLQHALNLLWKTANYGAETLDLIHLAKIAGISKDMLSDTEQQEFNRWYALLPDYQKKYYEKPDLNNVLNAHAGMLYESAFDYYMHNADWTDKTITPEESKQIIKTAFISLTKIDDNRQVRNRCTLSEITGIINKPNISNSTVCAVLNIFRAEGNTLLRPFAFKDDIKTQYLSGDTVLDITHEALIRNWKMLTDWDKEELANINEYNDYNTQVQRWADNGRSQEFLLSPGNYAIFSQWYEQCRPNQYWILKNDNSHRPEQEKLNSAINRMEMCETYMQQSHDALVAKEKSRRRKIAGVICGLLVFIAGLLLFSNWAMIEKEKAEEQTAIAIRNEQLANEQKAEADTAKAKAQQQSDSIKILYFETALAKKQSDIDRQLAEKAKNESDSARRAAEYAKSEADKMRQKAEDNYNIAEQERQKTLTQMELTKQANDSANKLYYVALCNTLAMKAKNQYEDKSLNLRLAKTACEMNQKGGADHKNADLYDAMLFAMEQYKLIQPKNLTDEPIKSFAIDGNGVINTFGEDGATTQFSISKNGEPREIRRIDNLADKVPVENAVFVTPSLIAYSTKDHKSYLMDIDGNRQITLPSHSDYIKTASPSQDGSRCAVAYAYGKVSVMPLDGNKPDAEHDFGTKITDVYFHGDDVYVLSHNGQLTKWNYKTNNAKTILPAANGQKAFCMTAIDDINMLAICYNDGGIQLLNLINDQKHRRMPGGHSQLDNVVYDSNTGILALSSADKRISLINTNDFAETPLAIEEHSLGNHKVKYMAFNNGGVLFAITDDNKMHFWDTNPETYASALSAMNLAPLSQSEWNLILGRDFPMK